MNSSQVKYGIMSSSSTVSELNSLDSEFESFDSFGSLAYLREYYSVIDQENDALLAFFAKNYKHLRNVKTVLEFGGGPTLYSLISAASKVTEIHFSEYLKHNRHEIRKWIRAHKRAFNWNHFIRRALELEGQKKVTPGQVYRRAELLKSKLKKVVKCNAFRKFSLKHNKFKRYDVVSVNFVPESITSKRDEWEQAIRNISALVKPKGYLFITSLKNSKYYMLDGKKFPAIKIDESDMITILGENGFDISKIVIRSITAHPFRGYEGMMFIRVRKKSA